MATWPIRRAKARLSALIKEAIKHGPQEITLRGKVVAVILCKIEYEKLKKVKPSFVEFMRQSPLVGLDIKFKRNRSLTRRIHLKDEISTPQAS